MQAELIGKASVTQCACRLGAQVSAHGAHAQCHDGDDVTSWESMKSANALSLNSGRSLVQVGCVLGIHSSRKLAVRILGIRIAPGGVHTDEEAQVCREEQDWLGDPILRARESSHGKKKSFSTSWLEDVGISRQARISRYTIDSRCPTDETVIAGASRATKQAGLCRSGAIWKHYPAPTETRDGITEE